MPVAPVTNINTRALAKSISTALGQLLQFSATATPNLPNLPMGKTDSHIMPTFTNNIISIGKFCDAGCTVTFTNTEVKMHNSTGGLVLHGPREPTCAKMWQFDLCPGKTQEHVSVANSAITLHPMQVPTLIPIDEDEYPHLPVRRPPAPPTHSALQPPPTQAPTTQQSKVPSALQLSSIQSNTTRITKHHHKAYDLPSTEALVKYLCYRLYAHKICPRNVIPIGAFFRIPICAICQNDPFLSLWFLCAHFLGLIFFQFAN